MISGFLTTPNINPAVQSQKMARSLKFQIFYQVEELYYVSSENKGADQLHGYRAVDLTFVFTYAKTGFLMPRLKFDQADLIVE